MPQSLPKAGLSPACTQPANMDVASGMFDSKCACRSESYRKLREAFVHLQKAGNNYSAALLAGADISAGILTDLRLFLQSDSNELPDSLRQLTKLLQSEVCFGDSQSGTTDLAVALCTQHICKSWCPSLLHTVSQTLPPWP